MSVELSVSGIGQQIYFIRDNRIMLDSDLAVLYEIETFNLNKAVKRNRERFPADFMYLLTQEEWASLTFQIGIAKKQGRGGRRTLPYGFTQEGVAMLSSVLNSKRACQVNITILRAFAKFRKNAESNMKLSEKVGCLETNLSQQLVVMTNAMQKIMAAVEPRSTRDGISNTSVANLPQPIPLPNAQAPKPSDCNRSTFSRRDHLKVEAIQNAVARYYQLSILELKSTTRSASIARPRQICMYLIRKYTDLSYQNIGTIFGGKDHTTVLHAFRKIEAELITEMEAREALDSIQSFLETEGIRPIPHL